MLYITIRVVIGSIIAPLIPIKYENSVQRSPAVRAHRRDHLQRRSVAHHDAAWIGMRHGFDLLRAFCLTADWATALRLTDPKTTKAPSVSSRLLRPQTSCGSVDVTSSDGPLCLLTSLESIPLQFVVSAALCHRPKPASRTQTVIPGSGRLLRPGLHGITAGTRRQGTRVPAYRSRERGAAMTKIDSPPRINRLEDTGALMTKVELTVHFLCLE